MNIARTIASRFVWHQREQEFEQTTRTAEKSPRPSMAPTIRGDEYAFLRAKTPARAASNSPELRWVDLFAGCGAMSLGIWEAACASGYQPRSVWSLDSDESALSVYKANFPETDTALEPIQNLFERPGTGAISSSEKRLRAQLGDIDLLVGGPPCQGVSDLNNYSRRSDARNNLYAYMARAALVIRPKSILIENVQGIPHDRSQVLQYTGAFLRELGYFVETRLINLVDYGVPQRRRRHVLVASQQPLTDLDSDLLAFRRPNVDVRWAIGDLVGASPDTLADMPSRPSADNRRRIEFLFAHGLYDLPNAERPPCHSERVQTYNSVYGRLRWERPAQTITSGFYSMCMGRYVHPTMHRTITAHEAARLQFIPDFFSFEAAHTRTSLARMVGNAVPPKLSYMLGSILIDRLRGTR